MKGCEPRGQLCSAARVIFTDPLLEPIRPYSSTVTVSDACKQAGLAPDIADKLSRALFDSGSDFLLRDHQAEALKLSVSDEDVHNVVVTSGTGSGKTEAFLLPLFARLFAEAQDWSAPEPIYRWWAPSEDGKPWRSCRSTAGRESGVRAIVLYPTNALVEDQIARLRSAH